MARRQDNTKKQHNNNNNNNNNNTLPMPITLTMPLSVSSDRHYQSIPQTSRIAKMTFPSTGCHNGSAWLWSRPTTLSLLFLLACILVPCRALSTVPTQSFQYLFVIRHGARWDYSRPEVSDFNQYAVQHNVDDWRILLGTC